VIRGFLEYYYALILAWRIVFTKQNRSAWFKGLPEWYVKGLAEEECPKDADEYLKMLHRQAKELSFTY